MKIFFTMIATYVAVDLLLCNKALAGNRDYLQNAQMLIEKFKKEKEPEYLREANFELIKVDLDNEKDSGARVVVRTATLLQWLNLLQVFDDHLDPRFDPDNRGSRLVQPPATKDGVVYPPGSDPKFIEDPQARAEYKKAIEENRKRLKNYRIQVLLHRLEDRIPADIKTFIRDNYTSTQIDQNELRSSIKKILKGPGRQDEFLKYINAR